MKSQSEHYDEYYKDVEKSPPFMDTMAGGKSDKIKIAIEAFNKNNAKKILEVGCGPGFETKLFLQKGFNVQGCDISKNAINYAKKKIQVQNTLSAISKIRLQKKNLMEYTHQK